MSRRFALRAVVALLGTLVFALGATGIEMHAAGGTLPRSVASGPATLEQAPDDLAAGTSIAPPSESMAPAPTNAGSEPKRASGSRVSPSFIPDTPCSPPYFDDPPATGSVQWSPDGSQILFTHRADVYAVARGGLRLRRVANVASPEPAVGRETAFHIAPNGKRLVYATCEFLKAGEESTPEDQDNRHDLVVARLDGTDQKRLTERALFESHPAWSPDGAHVAYIASGNPSFDSRSELLVVQADGARARTLSGGFDFVAPQPPVWSPDGRWLAVTGVSDEQAWIAARQESRRLEGDGRWALHLVAMPGGEEFLRVSEAVSGAAWSPDGKRLAFAKPDGDEVALYTIGLDGSNERRVIAIKDWQWQVLRGYGEPGPWNAWVRTVAWSPDGTKILYTCGRSVCVVDEDGSVVGQSPSDLVDEFVAAAWSPGGSRIVIVRLGPPDSSFGHPIFPRDQRIHLYTMAPDGSDARILVREDSEWGLYVKQARRASRTYGTARCLHGDAVADPYANPGLVFDCETLLVLQEAFAGDGRLGWTMDRPLSDWKGVTVGGTPRRVRELSLPLNALWGELPPEVGDLTHLHTLDLAGNYLGGPIPLELGGLKRLTGLYLLGNEFESSIPPALGELPSLEVLALNSNRLTGPIPAALGELSRLRRLLLENNRLTGPIPPELRQLASLTQLSLSGNQLTGSIPLGLADLSKLGWLQLGGNELTGTIPGDLGRLQSLQWLSLGSNRLSGAIPPEIRQLTNLGVLVLSANQLSGPIPPELGELTTLANLDLGDNRLTGAIPRELAQLSNLWNLDLSVNQLTGPIPPGLGELSELGRLDLSANQLTGSIPPALGRLVNLRELNLSGNQLSGTIPAELGDLAKIEESNLSGNELTGCIPPRVRIADRDLLGLPDCESQ